MDLETLVNKLNAAGRIKPSRLRDIRSSATRYARILGCPDPENCLEESYALNRRARNEKIEAELRDASPHVLRNVKNNINFILRQGEELGLIRPVSEAGNEIAPRQFGRRAIGSRFPSLMSSKLVGYHRQGYSLPIERWPTKLKQQYDEWKLWVTEAKVPQHYLNPRNSPATIENKTKKFEAFFGYLSNERRIGELDFEMLIDLEPHLSPQSYISKFKKYRKQPDVGLLEEFVNWHKEYRLGRVSTQAREVVSAAGSVARRYYYLKARLNKQYEDVGRFDFLAEEISRLRMLLDEEQPGRIISSDSRMVSIVELLKTAKAEFPQVEHSARGSGIELASSAGRALAIMLLIYHPLRNRYYREAQLGQQIIKKEDGQWYLRVNNENGKRYSSAKQEVREQLLSLDVISYVDRYLLYWRPKLVNKLEDKIKQLSAQGGQHNEQIEDLKKYKEYLFLNTNGTPFTRAGFGQWIQSATYKWMGVRVNPDLIRLISLDVGVQKRIW